MVLQREMPVPVWGTADKDETVTVRFAGQEHTTATGEHGRWRVVLEPLTAQGEPAQLVVVQDGNPVVTINDVLVGEVWLCSGQSNMVWTVSRAANAIEETATAQFPLIRHNNGGTWQVCTPETAGGFSAAAYYFGRHLHRELGVPIGLLVRAVGGTPIEFWTPREDLLRVPYAKQMCERYNEPESVKTWQESQVALRKYRREIALWRKNRKDGDKNTPAPKPPVFKGQTAEDKYNFGVYLGDQPGNLFRSRIKPVVGYGIRGVIWYQGERNARLTGGARAYRDLLPAMISSWRRVWAQGDFPFLYVQLPNFSGKSWPLLRESMLTCLTVPNTGMAVTIDIGGSLHPKNKQDVGKRLALLALEKTYKREAIGSSPLLESVQIENGKAVLTFGNTGTGLKAKDGKLTGFQVAGDDRVFHPATARILDGVRIEVTCADVTEPVAVRYAWAPDPKATRNTFFGVFAPFASCT